MQNDTQQSGNLNNPADIAGSTPAVNSNVSIVAPNIISPTSPDTTPTIGAPSVIGLPQTPETSAETKIKNQQPETQYLTGSQLDAKNKTLPNGIYAVVGVFLVGFIGSFFDSSQSSLVFSVAMLLGLLLGVGLMFKIDSARKAVLWMAAGIIVVCVSAIILLVIGQDNSRDLHATKEVATSKISGTKGSENDKKVVSNIQSLIDTQNKLLGKKVLFSYIKNGFMALSSIAIMIYLARPNVRTIFEDTDN